MRLVMPLKAMLPPGVIAVVMRVDQQINAVVLRALLQSVDACLCRVRKLAVHGNHSALVDQIADGAAPARVETHVAPDWRERRRPRRRCLLRRRRGRRLSLLRTALRGQWRPDRKMWRRLRLRIAQKNLGE
jgi:hypothetical protein